MKLWVWPSVGMSGYGRGQLRVALGMISGCGCCVGVASVDVAAIGQAVSGRGLRGCGCREMGVVSLILNGTVGVVFCGRGL